MRGKDMNEGLTNKQFVMITLVIMLCGIAIFGRDYVQTKRYKTYEEMELKIAEEESPEYIEESEDEEEQEQEQEQGDTSNSGLDANNSSTTSNQNNTNSTNNTSNSSSTQSSSSNRSDTSGRVKRKSKTSSKYVGRIVIPKINLNKGFVESPKGNLDGLNKCVDYNVCSFSGKSSYPNNDNSHLILGAHNGVHWNAFFNRIEELKSGDNAYIEYKNKRYKYAFEEKYEDAKGDYAISFHVNDANKQLSLFTCASHGNYNRWYTVINFRFISEEAK